MQLRQGAGPIPVVPADRPLLEALLRRIGLFREGEIAVALEVLDVYLERREQEDYRFFASRRRGELAGYVCFGPNLLTEGVFELYWLAVDPSHQRRGVGSGLLLHAESEARSAGGRMVAVETSGSGHYAGSLAFYRRSGYVECARVPDYYAPGDDKVIFTKLL